MFLNENVKHVKHVKHVKNVKNEKHVKHVKHDMNEETRGEKEKEKEKEVTRKMSERRECAAMADDASGECELAERAEAAEGGAPNAAISSESSLFQSSLLSSRPGDREGSLKSRRVRSSRREITRPSLSGAWRTLLIFIFEYSIYISTIFSMHASMML